MVQRPKGYLHSCPGASRGILEHEIHRESLFLSIRQLLERGVDIRNVCFCDHWDPKGEHGCKVYMATGDDTYDRHVYHLQKAGELILAQHDFAHFNIALLLQDLHRHQVQQIPFHSQAVAHARNDNEQLHLAS